MSSLACPFKLKESRDFSMARSCRGVTLMEVLIAMFVVSVGLLGLAALIPVGRWQIQEAARIDRGAALGRAAFRSIGAQSMLLMENWCYADNAVRRPVLDPLNNAFVQPPGPIDVASKMTPPLAPLVLDPLMIGANGATTDQLTIVRTFPYELPGTNSGSVEWKDAPRLSRITLSNMSPFSLGSGGASSPSGGWFLPPSLAERYFRGTDDIVFTTPNDPLQKPSRLFNTVQLGGSTASSVTPSTLQSQGDFSWFAMIAPNRFEAEGRAGPAVAAAVGSNPNNLSLVNSIGSARGVRQFFVTVVVCFKRDLRNLSTITYANRDPSRGERRILVDFISPPRFNQGSADAWMYMSDLRDRNEADQATSLRPGEWVLVMSYVPLPATTAGSASATPRMMTETQWFRVLSVGRNVTQVDGQTWKRRVRFTGNSWSVPYNSAINRPSVANPVSAMAPGYGVIVDGVVGVYRKTLVLDGTSMWSP